MNPLKYHVFVCTNERKEGHPRGCCSAKGSAEVLTEFKKLVLAKNLRTEVRAQRAGCLDACEQGVSVVVYPEGVWYARVKSEDVQEIVASHLIDGQPVERLRMTDK